MNLSSPVQSKRNITYRLLSLTFLSLCVSYHLPVMAAVAWPAGRLVDARACQLRHHLSPPRRNPSHSSRARHSHPAVRPHGYLPKQQTSTRRYKGTYLSSLQSAASRRAPRAALPALDRYAGRVAVPGALIDSRACSSRDVGSNAMHADGAGDHVRVPLHAMHGLCGFWAFPGAAASCDVRILFEHVCGMRFDCTGP